MNDLPLSNLDSNELYTGSKRIGSILAQELPEDSYVISLCANVDKGTTDMEKALGRALKSEFTSDLLEKDALRDNAFISLRDFVKSFVHNKDTAKATAAVKLVTIIKTIGNRIYKLGYIDETAKMNTLITTLKSTESAQNLQTIGATDRFAEMETDQIDFEKTYKSKVDTESAINLPLLKDAKYRVSKSIMALLIYVESNVEFKQSVYGPIEGKLNAVIDDVVAISRARITRVKNEKKAAGEKK